MADRRKVVELRQKTQELKELDEKGWVQRINGPVMVFFSDGTFESFTVLEWWGRVDPRHEDKTGRKARRLKALQIQRKIRRMGKKVV